MRTEGAITVYLSLITLLLISLIMVCLESARVAVIKTSAAQYADMASEMVFSGYVKPLADRYGLFVLDTGGSSEYISWYESFLKMNLESGGNGRRPFSLYAKVNNVDVDKTETLKSSGWKMLLEQVRRCEMYSLGAKGIKTAVNALNKRDLKKAGALRDNFTKDMKDTAAQASSEEAESEEARRAAGGNSDFGEDHENGSGAAQTQGSRKEEVKDPRVGIGRWIKSGILDLVMGDEKVSSGKMDTSDCSYKTGAGSAHSVGSNFTDYKKVSGKLDEVSLPDSSLSGLNSSDMVSDDPGSKSMFMLLNLYIIDRFSSLTEKADKKRPHVMAYETEYILWGRKSDRENLENTMSALCGIRTAMNLAYLYTDTEKKAAVEAVSSVVSAAVPAAGVLIKLLVLAAWAGAEAVVDCASLSEGGKVPLWKSDSTWNLTFSDMTQIAGSGGGARSFVRHKDKGLTYSQYITMLLFGTSKKKKIVRMLQLMEKNIRLEEGYGSFKFKECITGAKFTVNTSPEAKFFTHPSGVRWSVTSQYGY